MKNWRIRTLLVRSKAINQPMTPYNAMAAGALQTLIKKYFAANPSTSIEAGETQKPISINGFLSKSIVRPAKSPNNKALKRYARTSFSSLAPIACATNPVVPILKKPKIQ